MTPSHAADARIKEAEANRDGRDHTSGEAHQRSTPTSAIWVRLWSHGRSRLLSHLSSDEALGEPGIDNAPGIDLITLSFVAVVDAIPLDDCRVAI